MNECLIKNLCDGARDYPLKNGESVYLGAKGRTTGLARIRAEEISDAMRTAEAKGLLLIQEEIGGDE